MKVEHTIQLLFNEVPALAQTREDALSMLLLNVGNGYHWHEGQFKHKSTNISEEDIILEGGDKAKQVKEDPECARMLAGFRTSSYDFISLIYPIFNAPKDIDDDWKQAIKELADHVYECAAFFNDVRHISAETNHALALLKEMAES